MTAILSEHDLHQRAASALALLDRLAEAEGTDTGSAGDKRVITVRANVPLDAPFQRAFFEYAESYERAAPDAWRLTGYSYEYQQRPPPGRRAHHRHDPWGTHAHCVDPRDADRENHFRDIELDVFEAHGEFLRLYARGEPVECAGLFPLARER